jgi:DNA-binding NtrC family response regulator
MKDHDAFADRDPLNKGEQSAAQLTRPVSSLDKYAVMHVPRATLEVCSGPDEGQKIMIRQHRVVVGGAGTCDFVIRDPTASRRHCEIFREDEGYVLRDLGSTNGTFVRGLRANSVWLGATEEISLGHTVLKFSVLDEHDEVPLSENEAFGEMLGRSKVMRSVFAMLERAAQSHATVLLEGESGTGKDLAAESIHRSSNRAQGNFVVVDCGAVSPSLVGSELFGHCKGAFTGANTDRQGAFEAAHGGTVFLDEISSLDLSLQPQLLRLLERKEIKRVGENHYRKVDVRIIAATNRELANEVEQKRFRQDLFYRLSVIRVHLPPLRDRREDIELLAGAFWQKLSPQNSADKVFSDPLLAMFYNHDWPGNVRELRNVIERLVVLPDFPPGLPDSTSEVPAASIDAVNVLQKSYEEWKTAFERQYLESLLAACDGVVTAASRRSGIARQTLYRMLTKHNLK